MAATGWHILLDLGSVMRREPVAPMLVTLIVPGGAPTSPRRRG